MSYDEAKITSAAALAFAPTEGAPPMACNVCGKVGPPAYLAAIKLNDDGDTLSVVACSFVCVGDFKTNPSSDRYLASLLDRLAGKAFF